MDRLEKNRLIGDSRRATEARRRTQQCKTFKLKVRRSSLTALQKEQLKMQFVEAKWIYNYLLANSDGIFDVKTKYKELTNITHKDKNDLDVPVVISYIGSSMKQEIIQTICNEMKGLAVLKKKGHDVGKLKFKSEINSIPLKQYGNTHSIRGSRIKIQGIKKPIRVDGLKQMAKYENIDYANAKLIYDGYDYWINLTCYIDREKKNDNDIKNDIKNDILGLDFGVKTMITCSNGDKIDVSVEESERLKRLQARLARQKKGSNSWYNTRSLIRKEYNHMTNKKNDAANKIMHRLLSNNAIIVMQDEQINEWKTDMMSAKIQHSILGKVKSRLMQSGQTVILDKWFPTTRYCSNCGVKHDSITLADRTFVCPNCGHTEDRDIHAAKNMIYFYLLTKDTVGTTDALKPVTIKFQSKFAAKPEATMSSALL